MQLKLKCGRQAQLHTTSWKLIKNRFSLSRLMCGILLRITYAKSQNGCLCNWFAILVAKHSRHMRRALVYNNIEVSKIMISLYNVLRRVVNVHTLYAHFADTFY